MGLRYGTARNLYTITILPTRSRSQKLTDHDVTDFCKVQLVMRTVTPGVKTPRMGIGSGHRRVPNTRQYDVDSKILDKMSHGGASAIDKSTTGRFPYQQGTLLKGLKGKIRGALSRDRRKNYSGFR